MKRFISLTFLVLAGLIVPGVSLAKISNDPRVYQYSYEQAGVFKAWDYAVGSPQVVVAVIDNGFDTFHPDLLGNVWKNNNEVPNNGIDDDNNDFIDDVWGWNFVDDNNNPQPVVSQLTDLEKSEQLYNHGTFVAGIIGAVGNNNRDGAGVAWNVKLMNLKVLGNDGYGNFLPVVDAIYYAVDNGADIINVSMAGDYSEKIIEAVDYAFSKGVVVVAAMGNYNGSADEQPQYPACADAGETEPHVLGVSAVNEERRLANFSNTGAKCVDITAPGVKINSIGRYAPESGLTESYKNGWQGTSFAAPFVAGAAALVKSVQPDWKASQIYQALLLTTHHTPSDDEAEYARLYGKGLLQVQRAVAYASGLPVPPSMFPSSNDTIVSPVVPAQTTSTFVIIPKIKPIHTKTFVAVGAVGQMRDAYNDSFELGGHYERPEAKGIESAAVYGTGTDQVIVTVRVDTKKVRVVSIYNYRWQLQNSWNSNFTVPVQIAVEKRDDKTVIALAPTQNNKIIFELFDETGHTLATLSQSSAHRGAQVVLHNGNTYVVFTTENFTTVKVYDAESVLKNDFSITGMGVNPLIDVGDVTGDHEDDIVIGSGAGVGDQVQVYSDDGTQQRSFSPFGDGRKNGVSVVIVDADANGVLDLLTYSAGTAGPIRAWTAKAKNAGEWDAPFTGSFFLLPR